MKAATANQQAHGTSQKTNNNHSLVDLKSHSSDKEI
jgi:hypothetical protein